MFSLRRSAVEEVGEIGLIDGCERRHGNANQAEFGAIGLAGEKVAAGREDDGGELGRATERLGAGPDAEVCGLELERHRRASNFALLEASGDAFGEPPKAQFKRSELGYIALEGRLGRDAFGLALRPYRPVVNAAGKPRQPRALGAIAARQRDLAQALQVADRGYSVPRQARLRRLANAEYLCHRPRRQERGRLAAAEDGEPARLVEIGGDLGQEFAAGES